MDSFPQPLSSHSIVRLDCTILCYSIPDSSPIVNEDQVVNGIGVMQLAYAIVHDECVQESKEEPSVKDDSLPVTPHPLYPDIPCDFATADFPCENPFSDVSTFDHSQDTIDVILSLQCGEDTSSSENRPICHLSLVKTKRVNIFGYHLPLCLIHQIMRMATNILNFLILVVVIYSLPHLIMMLIQSL